MDLQLYHWTFLALTLGGLLMIYYTSTSITYIFISNTNSDITIYLPAAANANQERNVTKSILLWNTFYGGSWNDILLGNGQDSFVQSECAYQNCWVTDNKTCLSESDIVLFHYWQHGTGKEAHPKVYRSGQHWIFYSQESPVFTLRKTYNRKDHDYRFNASMTYMKASDIHVPYGQYVKRDEFLRAGYSQVTVGNVLPKNETILWYISDCRNDERLSLGAQLSRHIRVDQFGKCNRNLDPCDRKNKSCLVDFRSRYKFYLAFENNICSEYVTEKFWWSLYYGNVPIVYGPSMEYYTSIAPPDSFLHVDNFTNIEQLVDYVKYLDANDDQLLRYHRWRGEFTIPNDNPGGPFLACALCEYANTMARRPPREVSPSEFYQENSVCETAWGEAKHTYEHALRKQKHLKLQAKRVA